MKFLSHSISPTFSRLVSASSRWHGLRKHLHSLVFSTNRWHNSRYTHRERYIILTKYMFSKSWNINFKINWVYLHYQEKAMFSVSEILQLRKRKQRRKRHWTIANKPLQFLLIERKNEFWRKTYLKACGSIRRGIILRLSTCPTSRQS